MSSADPVWGTQQLPSQAWGGGGWGAAAVRTCQRATSAACARYSALTIPSSHFCRCWWRKKPFLQMLVGVVPSTALTLRWDWGVWWPGRREDGGP